MVIATSHQTTVPPQANAAVAQTPAVNTKLRIGGQEYELKNMTTARGLELYAALPAEYQAQADQIAQTIMTFASVQEVAARNGLDATELARQFVATAGNSDAAKAAANALTEAQKVGISALQAAGIQPQSLGHMLFGRGADVANGIGTVVGTGFDLGSAAFDGVVHGPARIWNLVKTLGTEGWGQVFGYGAGAPSDAAKAFAAATMGLRYQEITDRHAQPMFDINPFDNVDSQIGNNPVQYTKAGFGFGLEWLAQHIPGAEFIIAGWHWLTTWGENKPSFTQFVEQARADIATSKQKTPANHERFNQLADQAMWDKEGEQAEQVLKAAETIATLKTEALSKVATASKVNIRQTNGDDVAIEHGNVTETVTAGQRLNAAWHTVAGDGHPVMQGLRVGAAGATVVTVANNGAKGIARGLTAAVTNPSPATKTFMEWARKPVQLGVGEYATTGKWSLLNFPGKIAVGAGDVVGRVTRWTTNVVAGTFVAAKDYTVGVVKGVDSVLNPSTETAQLATRSARVGSWFGAGWTKNLPWMSPVATGIETVADIGAGDTTAGVLHGTETVGLGVAARAVGFRASPYIAPVMSTVEGINAAAHHDIVGVKRAGVELGTIGSFTAAGAGIGVWFGGIGAAPGALIGATIGGIASIFTGRMTQKHYDQETAVAAVLAPVVRPVAQATGTLPADAGLHAAAVEATQKAQAAAVAQVAPRGFAVTNITSLGSWHVPDSSATLANVHGKLGVQQPTA